MRLDRSLRIASLAAVLAALAGPSLVLADHCGAEATITPSSGPPGTTFVFATNVGASSDLRAYQDGALVLEVYLVEDGPVEYALTPEAGSTGTWRVRAEPRGAPECGAEATFTVIAPPDTATVPEPIRPPAPSLLIVLAGIAAFGLALRRFQDEVSA